MAKRGRKSYLTDELIQEACRVLRLGNYVKTTCGYLGITEATWYNWINDGENAKIRFENGEEISDEDCKKIELVKSVKKAQDEAIVRNIELIQTAAQSNWQAAAWTLERRYPDMFSLAQRIAVADTFERLDPKEIRQQLETRKQVMLEKEEQLKLENKNGNTGGE